MKTSNKVPRFFINQPIKESDQEISISDFDINHQIRDVLRLKKGDKIILLDGLGKAFFGKVKIFLKKNSIFSKEKLKSISTGYQQSVKLSPAVLKKDKFEYLIQKCTEIGVESFHPIISERTEKTNLNFERLNKIAKEASEQSERYFLPKINLIKTLEEFLIENQKEKNIFALQFNSKKIKISDFKKKKESVIFLIGPEGGWGEKDLKLFEKYKVEKISLGEQILRAETASISVASLILLGE